MIYELGTLVWYPILIEGGKRDCLPGFVVNCNSDYVIIFWSDLMETKHSLKNIDFTNVYTSYDDCQRYIQTNFEKR